jgi:biopolymer transport protein ExbB
MGLTMLRHVNQNHWLRLIFMILLVAFMYAIPATLSPFRMEARGAEADVQNSAESKAEVEKYDTLFGMIMASGASGVAFMVVLGSFSVAAATIGLERFINLTRRRILPPEATRELQELTPERHASAELFAALCLRAPSPLTNILKAGVMRAGRPLPEIEKSMEDATAKEMAKLRGSVRPLSVIANVAPLVGLLGTVVGMIDAFRVASQAGTGKAELLAQGIYLALLTTAAGLIIAIPSMLLAAYFNSRIDSLIWEADGLLINTMPGFARMEQSSEVSHASAR